MVFVILRLERMMRKNGHGRQQQVGAQDQNNLPGCHLPTSRLISANSLSARILPVGVAMSSGAVRQHPRSDGVFNPEPGPLVGAMTQVMGSRNDISGT